MLIKVVGKLRPSAVNILEGLRSFELQIWWEIPPWLAEVYPACSRSEIENPKEEDDGRVRAAWSVGVSLPTRSNDVGQKGQEIVSKKGRHKDLLMAESCKSKSDGKKVKSGSQTNYWGSEVFYSSQSGSGLDQQAGPLCGSSDGIINLVGLNGPVQFGSNRSPRDRKNIQKASNRLQKKLNEACFKKSGPMEEDSGLRRNRNNSQKASCRLKKSLNEAGFKKSGPKGDNSGLKNNMGFLKMGAKIPVEGDCLPRDIRNILLGSVLWGPSRKLIMTRLACRGPVALKDLVKLEGGPLKKEMLVIVPWSWWTLKLEFPRRKPLKLTKAMQIAPSTKISP